ncbi:PQQ-dependent sugar dehydrogenase [Pseudazoarcus pumilus]|uniref:Oxidoreductase n=1 Tax=Pseudazoarcus pumilus TaxID=2067960 RepID=A0A2I6S6S6_9RHOO|nr:PQQ-dependent sugar dehydrogenase [Pseudazoarcus pumilus]AUN94931.1 oxidoreductase [Pseudazoarcus pumilus]
MTASLGRAVRRTAVIVSIHFLLLITPGALAAPEAVGGNTELRVHIVAEGLQSPWALAFLPDARMLVTERAGRMRIVDADGRVSAPLQGVPRVHAQGQGGLLDVVLGPEFERDRTIFFSYAEATPNGARTAVARAELDLSGMRLRSVRRIFAQNDDPGGGHHFGSRLVLGADGMLFVTLGDRNQMRERSRRLDSHLGKIVRISPDGSVPEDNPFVGRRGALDEIWTYGHRNVQGAALHPDSGELWIHEHGPRGGDEVNIIRAGADYGWPDVTHGRSYVTRLPFGEATEREGVEAPVHYWVPTSIAPSGMAFYTGDAIPEWRGDLFVGALASRKLVRLELDGERVVAEHALLEDMGSRIRDVRMGPDGHLYVLDESRGRILRLEPGER